MTKEPHQPKAVNIIRPSNNYLNHSLSHSSSGSTTSTNSQRRSTVSSTSSNTNRKPRVTATNVIKPLEKPHLNLYHPPVRKPSYDNNKSPSSSSRPPIEIYKPQQPPLQLQQQHQQQRIMTKSMTVPLNLNYHEPPKLIHSRPMSPSYIRSSPQQQPQQYHRSVLGIINTPVVATTTTTTTIPSIIHSDTPSLPEMIDTNTTTSSSSSSLVSVNQEEDQDVNLEENELDDDDEVEEEEEEPVITEARVNRKVPNLLQRDFSLILITVIDCRLGAIH